MITAPFTILLGYTSGCVLAWVSKRGLTQSYDPIHTRFFAVVVFFATAVLTPSALSLYLMFPDWALMYMANSAHVPALLVAPLLLLFHLGAPPAGFLMTLWLQKSGSAWGLRLAFVSGFAGLALTFVLGWDRWTTVAYYDAYHHGVSAIGLSDSALLVPLLLNMVALFGAFAFSVVHVRRHLDVLDRLPS